jgi:hypothetical protein
VPEVIGENVDRLVTVEMRPGKGMPRGFIHNLYGAARAKLGKPLTYLAAKAIVGRVSPGDVVVITTGAADDVVLLRGETDGPLGAAAMARALELGLGAKPIVLTEERFLAPQAAVCEAAGLMVIDDWALARRRPGSVHLLALPVDDGEASAQADRILADFEPKLVFADEKLGPNSAGRIHSVRGFDFTAAQGKASHLFTRARERGVLTVGVGDGGNELGYGLIYEAARDMTEFGGRCQCPCGKGAATVVSADVLVVGATSNWGCYGIEAMIAVLRGDEELLHDVATEERMLAACIRAGGADGMYGRQIPYVDGTPAQTQTALIEILHTIVRNGLKTVQRPF